MKEEKLGKSDYNDPFAISNEKLKKLEDEVSKPHRISNWWYRNCTTITNWIIRIVVILVMLAALAGIAKCTQYDIQRAKQQEIEWTTGDSTFVKKQDGYYIYRREIEGHKYYLYKEKNEYDQLVNVQYVPVNTCETNE